MPAHFPHILATWFVQVGLHKFLPKSVINTNKPKPLRKLIQQHFRKYAVLGDLECMFKFFEILKSVYRFDQERYRCALGSGCHRRGARVPSQMGPGARQAHHRYPRGHVPGGRGALDGLDMH